jgi:hypothetical protein
MHACIRIIEHDMKLHAQNRHAGRFYDNMARLAQNLTVRDVKAPRFSFTVTKEKVDIPSFSGSDAAVIMADCEELVAGGCSADVCPIFQGVYSYNLRAPVELDSTNGKVLLELFPELKRPSTDFTDGLGPGISQRALAELGIQSLNELMKLLRKDTFNVDDYKRWVELYYQSTIAQFGHEGLTPYKLKLDMIWRILEEGEIQSTKNHLCESGEKTNHTAQKEYYRGTRDGANDKWSKNSCFQDLVNSFFGIFDVGMLRNPAESYEDKIWLYKATACMANDPPVAREKVPTYIEMVRVPVSYPKLQFGKDRPTELLRGVNFAIIGQFTQYKKKINGKIVSGQPLMEKLITEMGGTCLSDSLIESFSSKHAYLPNCFCLQKDEVELEKFVDYMTDTDPVTSNAKAPTKLFYHITKGDWTWVSADWIIQCYNENKLVDPATHIFQHKAKNPELFVRHKITDIPRQLQRQVLSNPEDDNIRGPVMARTALKRHRREVAKRDLPSTILRRARKQKCTTVRRLLHPARLSWYNFSKHCLEEERDRRKRLKITRKLTVCTEQREAARKWKLLTQTEKNAWQ